MSFRRAKRGPFKPFHVGSGLVGWFATWLVSGVSPAVAQRSTTLELIWTAPPGCPMREQVLAESRELFTGSRGSLGERRGNGRGSGSGSTSSSTPGRSRNRSERWWIGMAGSLSSIRRAPRSGPTSEALLWGRAGPAPPRVCGLSRRHVPADVCKPDTPVWVDSRTVTKAFSPGPFERAEAVVSGTGMSSLVSRSPQLRLHLCAGVLGLAFSHAEPSEAQEGPIAQSTAPPDTEVASTPDASPSPDAAPTKDECIEAHRECQKDNREGRLLQARERAKLCTNPSCPGLLVADCGRWLEELDQKLPSVVFQVRLDGKPALNAQIYADDKLVEGWTQGEALRVDPGRHTFRIVLPKHRESKQALLLSEGMRFRVVAADFTTEPASAPAPKPVAPLPSPPPRAAPSSPERPVPFVVYPLLGVGGLGLAGFAGFGLLGRAEKKDLEQNCKPDCTEDELATLDRRYLLADISLGVGAAAIVGAGVVYLTRPEKRPAGPTVGLTVFPEGGTAVLASGTF